MHIISRTFLSAVMALAAPSLAFAEPVMTSGVAVANGAAILTHASALGDCAQVDAGGITVDAPIVFDSRNGLALLSVPDRSGQPALSFTRAAPSEGERLLVVGYATSSGALDGRIASVGDRNLSQDPTRFSLSVQRRLSIATPLVVNTQGHLVGIMDAGGSVGPGEVPATHAAVAALVAETSGISTRTGRRNDPDMNANQAFAAVRGAMVQVLCYSADDLAPAGPDDTEIGFITNLIDTWLNDWSKPNTVAFDTIGLDHASRVNYYGNVVRRSEVIADKRRFADRWPLRIYTLREGSLSIECDRNVCATSGLVDYFAVRGAGGRQSVGVSDFVLNIDRNTGLIVFENGSVAQRGSADEAGALSMWRQRLRACRRNRSTCGLLEYTESVMAEIGICPVRSGGNQPDHCNAPAPVPVEPEPAPEPVAGVGSEVTSSSRFMRGQTEVVIADYGRMRIPSRGELVLSVNGQINNLDPGTPGDAVIMLRIGSAEIPVASLALPANFQTTNVSQTLRLNVRDLPDTGARRPDVSVYFRTGRRSIHTGHNTAVRLEFR